MTLPSTGASAVPEEEPDEEDCWPPSFFISFTSERKMRIDWPRLRAMEGSLGAAKSSNATTMIMTIGHGLSKSRPTRSPFFFDQSR
jgi:hypothetical protein